MRTLSFDQFEFDNPSSEETVELWIAAKSDFPFPDVRSFIASATTPAVASELGISVPFDEHGYGLMAREYLLRFTGISVPQRCDWPTYTLVNDTCDWDAVFEAPGLFIRFHWWSTA